MFERFNSRARRVVVLAQEEARLLDHSYIGTEHFLLGLLAEQSGAGARALIALNVSHEGARTAVLAIIGRGEHSVGAHIPFTPRAKRVLELSLRESIELGGGAIGTGHLLLGLLKEGEGVGVQALTSLGLSISDVRARVLEILSHGPESDDVAEDQPEPLRVEMTARHVVAAGTGGATRSDPGCPRCASSLTGTLACRVVETLDYPVRALVFFCAACGYTISAHPEER